MSEKRKTRLFIDEKDYQFIMDNKAKSGVSMQEFISLAIKSQIASMTIEIKKANLKQK